MITRIHGAAARSCGSSSRPYSSPMCRSSTHTSNTLRETADRAEPALGAVLTW